jgi:DnaK suppressor protein
MSDDADGLSQEQVASLRALLEARLAEVQQALAISTDNARPVDLNLSIGRLTRVDALQQQHMASAQKSRLQTQLAQIRQAMARIASGTYGECVRCEEPIGYARLRVRPETPFCIGCQGSSER